MTDSTVRQKVTVLVPCYNHEKYITTCIDSIFGQTYTDFNLVVVDDGSTDNSLNVLKKLHDRYKFELISQSNMGLINTINSVLVAKPLGELLCILASDDYWPIDKLSKQVDYMTQNPTCYLSFGNYTEVSHNNKVLETVNCRPPESRFFEELLLTNYIPAPTTMIRTSVFKTVGIFDPEYRIEDWDMWLKILKAFPHKGYLNHNLAFYRLHPGNSHKNIEFITEQSFKILKRYRDEPLYPMATALVRAKHIIKCFLFSFRLGIRALILDLNYTTLKYLVICIVQQRGPFRKRKFNYFNFVKTADD